MSTTAETLPSTARPAQPSTLAWPEPSAEVRCQALNGRVHIDHGDGIGGIATSGARGRSFSLGIADSVTVLAADAATADVAATLIANAVDIDHPAVVRRPASDSRSGQRPR